MIPTQIVNFPCTCINNKHTFQVAQLPSLSTVTVLDGFKIFTQLLMLTSMHAKKFRKIDFTITNIRPYMIDHDLRDNNNTLGWLEMYCLGELIEAVLAVSMKQQNNRSHMYTA